MRDSACIIGRRGQKPFSSVLTEFSIRRFGFVRYHHAVSAATGRPTHARRAEDTRSTCSHLCVGREPPHSTETRARCAR